MTVKKTSVERAAEFTESKLILVEGKDDQELLVGIIEYMKFLGFQVHSMGGKTKWQAKTRAIASSDSFQDNVSAVGMVRDCDDSPGGAWTSCTDSLQRSGLESPGRANELSAGGAPRTAIALMPSPTESGTLEDLVIPTLNAARIDCVGSYISCLSKAQVQHSTGNKAVLQTYLAGLSEAVRDLHIAIASGEVSFAHPQFAQLKDFVQALASVSR